VKAAVKKYVEFHQFEPRSIGEFGHGFSVPREAFKVGTGKYVLYRSDKLNPTTGEDEGFIDYIHEHKPGVSVYRTDAPDDGPLRRVPKYICETSQLVLLGECLGFAYEDEEGQEIVAEPGKSFVQLYTIPSGKALLVIEGQSRVCALIWGGKLGVEPRGIVG
jgi:hypothetical protein